MIRPVACIFLSIIWAFSIDATNYDACTTPNRERGSCISLQSCPNLYDLLQSPNLSDSDRRFLSLSQCGYVDNNVLICCANRYLESVTPSIASQPVSTTTLNRSASKQNLLPQPPQCGKYLKSYILGGTSTHIDEFPWMALIEYTKPRNEKGHHCGGTLINNRYVLTAAHCVTGMGIPTDWSLTGVRLGEWDTTTNPDCEVDTQGTKDCAPPHLDIAVEQKIPHQHYVPNTRNELHDIALLRLAITVSFNDFVKPICLPIAPNLREASFMNTILDVSGWGRTESSAASTLKLKANVNVWNLDECRRTYRQQNIRLETSQMCAGGKEGVDSCSGDSGGPLVVEREFDGQNIYFLAGVVSFGPKACGLPGLPGVYTRVGGYIEWIQNTIRA